MTYWRCLVQNFWAMICQLPTAPRCLKGRVKHSRWIPTKCPAPSNSQQATQGNQVESSMHLTMSSLGLGRSQAPDRKQVCVVLLTCVCIYIYIIPFFGRAQFPIDCPDFKKCAETQGHQWKITISVGSNLPSSSQKNLILAVPIPS